MSVGVIGGGISGLAVTQYLSERDIDVVTFEREARPGGIIQSRRVDGRVLELGPQRLRRTPAIDELIAQFDLESAVIEGNDVPVYMYIDDKLQVVPLSIREAIRTDLLSWRGKGRILYEPFTQPQQPGETVEEFLTRKFGAEAARRYFGPLYSGLYGTEPSDMLMEYSLGEALKTVDIGDGSIVLWLAKQLVRRRETPPIISFEDGLQCLPEAIASANADSLHLEEPVTAIEPGDQGYHLTTTVDRYPVDEVVIATQAPQAAHILEQLCSETAQILKELSYNPIGMVFLRSDFDGEGIGFLVPPDGDLPISGMTWNASVLDRDEVYTAYIDTNSYPELLSASDGELGTIARESFEHVTGASASVLDVHRWEPGMPAYDRSWAVLERLEPPPGIHFCTSFTDRPGILGRLRQARQLSQQLPADD